MRRALGLFGLVLVLLAIGGVAVASIPDAQGVIHGCRKNTDGSLKVIDSATQTCGNGYTVLNWQTGTTFYQVRTESVVSTDGAGSSGATAVCNTGDVVTGGGYQLTPDIAKVTASEPVPDAPQRWAVNFDTTVIGGQVTVTVFAVCAHAGL